MKKLYLMLLCVLFVIGLSGCMRFDTTFNVGTDGKADISMVYAVLNMDEGDIDTSEIEGSMDEIKQAGWECEMYNQDGYIGFTCTKKGVDLEKIADAMQGTEGAVEMEENGLSVTKNGDNYTIDWKILGDENANEMSEYAQYFEQYGGYMRIVFKLPSKAKNHNATTTADGGKTLTWDLLKMNPGENLHVEFSISMLGTIIMWVLIGIGALIVIAAIIFVIMMLKKKKAANGGEGGAMSQPGFDQAQQNGQQAFDTAQQYGQQAFDQAQQNGQQAYDQAQQYGQQAYDQAQQYGQQAYDQAQQYDQQAYDQAQQYDQQAYDQAQQYDQHAYDQSQQYDPNNFQ